MKYVVNAKFLGQQITGTQQMGIGLSAYLKNGLVDTQFVTTSHIINTPMAKDLGAISIGKKSNFIWEQWELLSFLKKHNNPLLIDFGNTAPIFYKNKVVTILDLTPVLHPEWFSFKSATYMKLIIDAYIKNSRKIIAISEYTKKTIVERYKVEASSIDVVYPACPEIFSTKQLPAKKANPYGRFILAVSSIDPRKNFLGLIKAFKQAKMKDVKLLIVGSENKVFADQDLKKEISDNKDIIFTGYVSNEELIALYQDALFFVYPSFFEGFGLPPLEAMKCGCPTIVSDKTSLPEVCGNASLYIDPYKLDTLVDSMRMLLDNETLRKELQQKGFEQANVFSWQKSAGQIINIVKGLN